MSFKIPLLNRSIIKSDEGFTIKFVSGEILRYSDKELVLCIGFDSGANMIGLMCKTLTQLAPHPGEDLSALQEKRVFDNIINALTWRGLTVDFIT